MDSKPRRDSAIDARDVLALIGLALLGAGLFLIWLPLALIVPGAIVTHWALYGLTEQAAIPKRRQQHDNRQ